MRIRILPSSPDGAAGDQHLISFLVGDDVAIDGGCLGLQPASNGPGPLDVFLTHAHLDHVATLPLFVEDRHDRGVGPIRIHGAAGTLDDLSRHFFNSRIWVDDARVRDRDRPWVEFHAVEAGTPVEVNGLRLTPVPVHHTVPTYGYVVDDGRAAVAFGADSGPTERIWEVARATGRLRAAFIECSFPDSHATLAGLTGHLTPRLLRAEARKLPEGVDVVAVHLKPRFRERILEELAGAPPVAAGVAGRDYEV